MQPVPSRHTKTADSGVASQPVGHQLMVPVPDMEASIPEAQAVPARMRAVEAEATMAVPAGAMVVAMTAPVEAVHHTYQT